MNHNTNNRARMRMGPAWLVGIAILSALWLTACLPVAASADGMETHGGSIKPASLATGFASQAM